MMSSNNFTPDKYQRLNKKHDPFEIKTFSMFSVTSSIWITFRDPMDNKKLQSILREAFEVDLKVYDGFSDNQKSIEFPEPLVLSYISKTIKGALHYLK